MVSTIESALERRVFADTCVINRLVDFGEYFFDNCLDGNVLKEYETRPSEDQEDIEALWSIVQVYWRASIPLYVSPTVLDEVERANHHHLESFTREIMHHWMAWGDPDIWRRCNAVEFESQVVQTAARLTGLKDHTDRILVSEAVEMGCDVFLTVDRKSLWNLRDTVKANIRIMRPIELWEELKPWAALVC